jgi:uncharacterized protein
MHDRDFEIIHKHVFDTMQALNPLLTYHCIAHTTDVIEQATRIAMDEGVNHKELYLLKIAALYHDSGFLEIYFGHEEKGSELFLRDADRFKFSESEKKMVVDLIMATKMPQEPKNLLQKIICDADLDYLGRRDFFNISESLKTEFLNYKIITNENEWHQLQLSFLENHKYHTNSSRLLRQPVKKANIATLKLQLPA